MSRFENLEFGRENERECGDETLGQGPDATLHLHAAETAFRRGDFEQALRAYAKVLEFNPASETAWAGQVRMLIELDEIDEARLWADKALEQFPDEPELLAAKAVTLARSGDTGAALSFSDAAVGEASETPYVWLARGDVLLARKERRAEYCFNRALAAGGGDWIWPWLASRVHHYYRRFSTALKLARQAMALDGCLAVVWLQMCRCQSALGLTGPATESLAQARELDRGCPEAERVADEIRRSNMLDRLAGRLRRWFGG